MNGPLKVIWSNPPAMSRDTYSTISPVQANLERLKGTTWGNTTSLGKPIQFATCTSHTIYHIVPQPCWAWSCPCSPSTHLYYRECWAGSLRLAACK